MIYLGEVLEIYITNECNLTCSNCNRFNNYDFRGHYYWKDYRLAIAAWSKRITADTISIIGGEPTLHPELFIWKRNLERLWPDSVVMVQSNGIYTKEKIKELNASKIIPVISIHDKKMFKKHEEYIATHKMSIPGGNNEPNSLIIDATEFTDCALIDNQNSFSLHNSDPESAFICCSMKYSHTIFEGRLHRCPLLAVLPEFAKQYKVKMSEEDLELLKNPEYVLEHDCSEEDLKKFFYSIMTPMNVCKFCPGEYKLSEVKMDSKRKLHQRLSN
jgi:organic radical activating enzyme